MNQKIFDYDELVKLYTEEWCIKCLSCFESDCFDLRIKKLFSGIMNQNWLTIQQECTTLNGSSNFLLQKQVMPTVSDILNLVFQHSTYPKSNQSTDLEFLESFNDEVRLQAMDFIIPIFEELRLLKLEISKYTKSEVPENYLQKEMEQIKQLHENLKKEYQMNQTKSQTINSVIMQLDKPENVSCTEKCIIF